MMEILALRTNLLQLTNRLASLSSQQCLQHHHRLQQLCSNCRIETDCKINFETLNHLNSEWRTVEVTHTKPVCFLFRKNISVVERNYINSISCRRFYNITRQFCNVGVPQSFVRPFSSMKDSSEIGTDVSRNDREETEGTRQSEEQITLIIKSVVASVSHVDKMILSIPKQKIHNVVETLLNHDLSTDQVEELLIRRPGILKVRKLNQNLSLLRDYDFSSENIFKVLKESETLSDLRSQQVENIFDSLRSVGMDEVKSKELITNEPNVLSLHAKDIQAIISQLKNFFKTDDVLRVVLKTPIILVCDWDEIEKKFSYAYHEMNVSQRQIMYSHLFAYPLHHVRDRHQFLVRAGLYGSSRAGNPRLQDVIDTSDSDFAKQFGGMHVDEYTTFCKMMAKVDLYENSEDN